MAFSSTIFVTLASLLIFITTLNAITNEQINDICTRAISKNACLQVLRSTPGVATSDLKGVGRIALDVSNSKLTNAKSIIPSLIAKTSDPDLKKRYNVCKEFFNDAGSAIVDAKESLNHNDPESMNAQASAAETFVDDCNDNLKSPPADPSDLSKRCQNVFDALSIALVISNML